MSKKWGSWLLLAAVTVCNKRLFLSRWAEEPRAPFKTIFSDAQIASLAIGFGALVLALCLLDILRSMRFVGLLLLLAVTAGVVLAMPSLGVYRFLEYPVTNFVAAGAVAALVCCQLKDSSADTGGVRLGQSFSLMTLASLNAFFVMAPWTTLVPSYVQDYSSDIQIGSGFFFGSVHSDISPVSIGLRWVINQFFAHPSINATALSSMLYVSLGLAMAALSLEMVFGRLWGWPLLFFAWTDRWLFASGISSAIIGQPVLSTAYVLLLCTWALWRKPVPLSWKESMWLGAVNAAGLVYNLYSYSAARMTWLVGSGIAALILIARKAVWVNFDGFRKVAVSLLPAAACVVLIWTYIFGMNTEGFVAQLLISPKVDFRIKDVNSYRVKVISVHDPDVPIWWGTGRPADGENVSLFWKRTPQEVFDKVVWFMEQVSGEPPIPFVLVLLGGIGMAVGLASPVPLRRRFSSCLIVLTLVSFSTYVLAQDPSAYRRAIATNLLIIAGMVQLFAIKSRGRSLKLIAIALCGGMAVLKAPTELNILFTDRFWSPVCVNCQPMINVRLLVNDLGFAPVAGRPLRYIIRREDISPQYTRCASRAFESDEFKSLAPNSSELILEGRTLSQAFSGLEAGDVLVVTCSPAGSPDPELSAVCRGQPPFGRLIATIPSAEEKRARGWWTFIEKP